MYGIHASESPWYLAVILVVGLISAALARYSEGSSFQGWCQRLFVLCLAIVGGMTFVSLGIGRDCCLMSGATLSVMAVTAVWDVGNRGAERAIDAAV